MSLEDASEDVEVIDDMESATSEDKRIDMHGPAASSKPRAKKADKASPTKSLSKKPRTTAKAKSKPGAGVPDHQTPKAEEVSAPGAPAAKKLRTSDPKSTATFARRYAPTREPGAMRWKAMKSVFQEHIKPRVTAPSGHEDWQSNTIEKIARLCLLVSATR